MGLPSLANIGSTRGKAKKKKKKKATAFMHIAVQSVTLGILSVSPSIRSSIGPFVSTVGGVCHSESQLCMHGHAFDSFLGKATLLL